MAGPPIAENSARPFLMGTWVPPASPLNCRVISPTREIPEQPATCPQPIMPPEGLTGSSPDFLRNTLVDQSPTLSRFAQA